MNINQNDTYLLYCLLHALGLWFEHVVYRCWLYTFFYLDFCIYARIWTCPCCCMVSFFLLCYFCFQLTFEFHYYGTGGIYSFSNVYKEINLPKYSRTPYTLIVHIYYM